MNKNVKIFDGSDISGVFVYRFSVKDTLRKVAEKFHTSVGVLVALNGLTEPPSAGEYILVEKTEGRPHTVTPTETLEKSTPVTENKLSEIKIKNRAEYFYVGQKIFL